MAVQAQATPKRTGSVKPRVKGIRSLWTHRAFRRVTQLAFAAFILYITLRHAIIGEESGIVTASPEAYCPFGGLETLYRYITGGGAFISHTHLSNVVVLAGLAVTALLARSAFCGWICPLGFLQEMVSAFSRFLQKKLPGLRKLMKRLRADTRVLPVLDRYLRYLKYAVLAWAVIGAGAYGYMVFKDYDPWSALISLGEFSFTPGLVVLGITLAAALFVERPWCRYACPLGAASGLLGKLSPVYLAREESACTGCQICTRACPMGLNVHTASTIKSADCITCLECVGACPRSGALEVRLGLPLAGKAEGRQ